MNSIILFGRTTSAIELKQTQAGKSVANFAIAVKRPFTKDTTDFHNVVCWDKQAELISKYVKKGDQVCIRGYLTNRTWTDNQNNKRYATEVIADEVSFVGNRESSGEAKNEASTQPYMPGAYTGNNQNFEEIPNDGDLPF
jgi:single-strand DNA-binding protein